MIKVFLSVQNIPWKHIPDARTKANYQAAATQVEIRELAS